MERTLEEEIARTEYPGRGIAVGLTKDRTCAVAVYFIMGRSANSRNRIFVEDGNGIRTEAFDPAKLEDPSLIIYAPVRVLGNDTIVTNGDQTDTIYEGLSKGLTFEQSLRSRTFEPDGPNYTPRISARIHVEGGKLGYDMSILKSDRGNPEAHNRYTFSYENPVPGTVRFIHTYRENSTPLPSFHGEPDALVLPDCGIDELSGRVWRSLDEENKVSLFVRFIRLSDGTAETRIVNKNVR